MSDGPTKKSSPLIGVFFAVGGGAGVEGGRYRNCWTFLRAGDDNVEDENDIENEDDDNDDDDCGQSPL